MLSKRALLIGINYFLDPNNRLSGCVNDAKNMSRYLRTYQGFTQSEITLLTDESLSSVNNVGYDGIIQSIYELCISSWKDNLDLAVFHYSGHGSQEPDKNAEERDSLDEGLVPVDYLTKGLILDDLLQRIFLKFNPKTKVVVFVDACHSGSILDLAPISGGPTIVCLSGCRDNQYSADVPEISAGAMTSSLLKLITDKPKYKIVDLVKDLNNSLARKGYEQRSELTSSFFIDNQVELF
jgi:hypothetical protein